MNEELSSLTLLKLSVGAEHSKGGSGPSYEEQILNSYLLSQYLKQSGKSFYRNFE